jgi:purine-binding chemotaxis protein CheW
MVQEQDQLLASVFRIAEGQFAVPAAEIQEVVQVGTLTAVHHAPAYVAGIRNLRGHIVSVIDLGVKLGLGTVRRSAETRVLIVNCNDELIGLMVEAVDDTVFVDPNAVSSAPPFTRGLDPSVTRGIYHLGGRLVTLLDQNSILQLEITVQTSTGPNA